MFYLSDFKKHQLYPVIRVSDIQMLKILGVTGYD